MSTITKLGLQDPANQLGASPYGNLTAFRYVLKTTASGAVEGGDSAAAVAAGDTVKIGLLPAGFRLIDSEVIVKTGMTATITAKVGFAYADGVDSAVAPQDDDYFGTGLNVAAAGRLRSTTAVGSVVLPKEAWLTVTTGGAANAKASELEVIVFAINEGVA
ncbi:MAG: hypothetical protein RBT67_02700 [Thauera sp.]|jgi:hypothetical protein|nr:hypothetical protein [Thauera sp.]